MKRWVTLLPVLLGLSLLSCDGSSDEAEISVLVELEGDGAGRVRAISLGVPVDCRIENGTQSGTCSGAFVDDRSGSVRLEAIPTDISNFDWSGDCFEATGQICDLAYISGTDMSFEVSATFTAKTRSVRVTPNVLTLSEGGEENAVILDAQAINADGREIFGVPFTWSSSQPDVVSVTPNPNNSSQATLIALKSGSSIITVTAQGRSARVNVDVRL